MIHLAARGGGSGGDAGGSLVEEAMRIANMQMAMNRGPERPPATAEGLAESPALRLLMDDEPPAPAAAAAAAAPAASKGGGKWQKAKLKPYSGGGGGGAGAKPFVHKVYVGAAPEPSKEEAERQAAEAEARERRAQEDLEFLASLEKAEAKPGF